MDMVDSGDHFLSPFLHANLDSRFRASDGLSNFYVFTDIIKALIIITTSPTPILSFPGLTGESRKALDARLKPAGMTAGHEWSFKKC
jgi:hypothetical protein